MAMQEDGSAVAESRGAGEILSEEIPTIADTINELHDRARRAAVSAVEDAVQCGQLLLQQRDAVPHGQWQDWVGENLDMSYSTAAKYIRAAKYTNEGLPFSALNQLYGPSSENETENVEAKNAKRQVAEPPTQVEAEAIELVTALEKLELPLMSAETFVSEIGRDFLTEKANERLEWLVALNDTLCNLETLPQ